MTGLRTFASRSFSSRTFLSRTWSRTASIPLDKPDFMRGSLTVKPHIAGTIKIEVALRGAVVTNP